MTKGTLYLILTLLVIIIIQFTVIFFRKPVDVDTPSAKEQVYKDSIAALNVRIEKSHLRQKELQASYDSLVSLDERVIFRTRDKIKFIYSASPDELDSIIRSNWKTQSRHR